MEIVLKPLTGKRKKMNDNKLFLKLQLSGLVYVLIGKIINALLCFVQSAGILIKSVLLIREKV